MFEPPIFHHIVCGVDGTPESLTAVRQSARLAGDDGVLLLVAVADLAEAVQAGFAAVHAADAIQQEAEDALVAARKLAPSATEKLIDGDPARVMLAEAERATLVVVGTHGRGRAAGLLLGTVAAKMMHDAPCSVLIARPERDPEAWPRSVVVGVDGSFESAAAYTVARSVNEQFGAVVHPVASTRDHVDLERAHAVAPELAEESVRTVDALLPRRIGLTSSS